MATFEVSAHMTVRPGQLEGFKKQAAECIRITKEKDTHTLRYDWFLSEDETVPGLRRQPLHDGLRRAGTTADRSD